MILGGHSVPDDKVKVRYERVIPYVAEATKYADRTFVLDNSHYGRAHQLVMVLEHGKISSLEREIPAWAEIGYKKQIEAFHLLNANEKKDLDSKILDLVSNAQIHHAAPGKFEGRIAFETPSLVAQRLGDTSKHFVIHEKNSLEQTPKINVVVSILHSNRSTRATVKSLDMSSTKEIKR